MVIERRWFLLRKD